MTLRGPAQRGATLIEALVAVLVLSLSLIAALRLQTWLRTHSDLARERSEALEQARQALEEQRAFRDLAAFDAPAAHQALANTPTTTFKLEHEALLDDGLKTERVTVLWKHRNGEAQQLQLSSGTARLSPVYSALLEVPPQDKVLAPPRISSTPTRITADGRSIVTPTSGSHLAWVIDGTTGDIQLQCTVAASTPARTLRVEDLADCQPFKARLLRGFIRFALSNAPDPLQANDAPLPLSVQAADHRCESETVANDGERYIAYACALPVGAKASVEPTLVPQGWAFGLKADAFRACRYPGAASAPHNYLVIRGHIACPSAVPPHNGAPVVTVQHQP